MLPVSATGTQSGRVWNITISWSQNTFKIFSGENVAVQTYNICSIFQDITNLQKCSNVSGDACYPPA